MITVGEYSSVYRGDRVTLLDATAADDRDGVVEVSVSVSDPDGGAVDAQSGAFLAEEIGTYTVIYTAEDSAGNAARAAGKYSGAQPVRRMILSPASL